MLGPLYNFYTVLLDHLLGAWIPCGVNMLCALESLAMCLKPLYSYMLCAFRIICFVLGFLVKLICCVLLNHMLCAWSLCRVCCVLLDQLLGAGILCKVNVLCAFVSFAMCCDHL